MKIRYCAKSIAFILFLFSAGFAARGGPISSGHWVKLKIATAGVYKVTFSDLSAAGFDMNTLDPRKLQLRGHQCGMISESNVGRQTGMPEIPMLVSGQEDGKFDAGDYILFYAGSKDKWNYNALANFYEHSKNLYSDEGFLYLGAGQTNGLRIMTQPEVTSAATFTTSRYVYTAFHDSDMVNPIAMGRTWIGEKLGNETLRRSFTFNMPSDASDSVYVKVRFAGGMLDGTGSVKTVLNGVADVRVFTPMDPEEEAFILDERRGMVISPSKQVTLDLELSRPNTECAGWLDYVELNTLRPVDAGSSPLVLRYSSYQQTGVTETRLAGNGNLVWNVSDEMRPAAMVVNGASGYDYFRSAKQNKTGAFVAFRLASCFSPKIVGTVANADILSGEAAEFIIISHPDFINEANDLAAFRRQYDGYSVKVVTPAPIYNEYSASQQDIVAIRDYLRDEYNKSLLAGKTLKFVLLMGSTSYDPKNRVPKNTNFIPTYQHASIFKDRTFCLDDFYTYLDSASGDPNLAKNKMWFSIGRIPARTNTEAKGVVAKLKRYSGAEALGPWRNEITFVCDDVDDSWEREFVEESEKYATTINSAHPNLLLSKVYTDAYKQVSTGNSEKYPDVSSSIDRSMNNGALFLNYQGHGGEKGWAQEGILTVPMINSWKNYQSMPVLFTATCEFSRFDDPSQQSGGELSLLNPDGGAIALMTTTRLVYVSGNSAINLAFWTNYGFPKANEPVPTVGDLYLRMKNRPNTNYEDNKFALLGDPSMRLAFPEHEVILDSVNGKEAITFTDTLKAFSVVKMKGHIEKRTGGKFADFNGNLWVKVLDKPQTKYTLDNDNHDFTLSFKDQSSVIFKGVVTVANGEFSIIFAIPKDIAYNVDFGKISLYAHNGQTDATGAQKLLLGGSLDDIAPDNQGPQVKLFMNDTTFVNGGNVLANSIFLAKVSDESGINATGAGIGRDLIAVLDPGTEGEKTFILNDYFSYDLNSYTKGTVAFDLEGISEGKHTILFKVWDIHNNSAQAGIEFHVVGDEMFVISENLVKPNPFQNEVSFEFTHNLAGKNMQATVSIFDLSGRQLVQFGQHLDNTNSSEDRLSWNGKTQTFNDVKQGLYFYRVDLTSEDGRKASFNGKVMRN